MHYRRQPSDRIDIKYLLPTLLYCTVSSQVAASGLHRFLKVATKDVIILRSVAAPSSTGMSHRMQLLHSLQQHPASAAPQVLAGCNYSTVCSSTQPPLLHRFLQAATQDATTPQSAAAPRLRCSTDCCRLPHRMQLLHSLQQHPASAASQVLAGCHKGCNYSTVHSLQHHTISAAPQVLPRCHTGCNYSSLQQHPASAAPQVLAGCNFSTVCSSTQPPLLHRFLQVATKDATTPLSAAAPSLICYTQVLAGCHTGCNYSTVCSSTRSPLLHRFLQVVTQDETNLQSAAALKHRCSTQSTGSCRFWLKF
jgi:hypothetical protein